MSKFLSANRVALILHGVFVVLTAVGIFLATVNHSLPAKWQTSVAAAITIIGALTAATVAVTKYLDGSQKFDALQARADLQAAEVVQHVAHQGLTPQSPPTSTTGGGGATAANQAASTEPEA